MLNQLDLTPSDTPRVVRALSAAEVKGLTLDPPGTGVSHHKRISQRHHFVAKCLASGMSVADAASLSGYTTQTLIILQNNPAFQELINHYAKTVNDELLDISRRLKTVSADALDIIQDRLENDPDKIPISELRELTKMGADRTGFGPQNSTIAYDGGKLSNRMQEARKRLEERRKNSEVIDLKAEEVKS